MTSAFHQSGLALRLFDYQVASICWSRMEAWKSRLFLEDLARKGKIQQALPAWKRQVVEHASGIRGATLIPI